MPTVTGFATAINMSDPVNFGALATSAPTGGSSSTSFTLQNVSSGGRWQITGTGFTNYSGGLPGGGTITSIIYFQSNVQTLSITGLSLSMPTVLAYLNNDDMQGLLEYIFAGADTITGSSQFDNLFGYGGNDTISSGASGDALAGGDGDDTLTGAGGIDFLYGDAGTDLLNGGGSEDWLYGGAGNDTLNGGDGNDLLYSGTGVDTIDGGAGLGDKVFIDRSNVTTAITFSPALLGSGLTLPDGTFIINVETFDFTTGSGADVLNMPAMLGGMNRFNGGGGVDTININLSADTNPIFVNDSIVTWTGGQLQIENVEQLYVQGGNGDDIMRGGEGDDQLSGGNGRDMITGNGGADTLNGQGGNDEIFAMGSDTVSGGDGDDTIYVSFDVGGSGGSIDGGDGYDALELSWTNPAGVSFAFSGGGVTGGAVPITSIERLRLNTGGGDDTLTLINPFDNPTSPTGSHIWFASSGFDTLIADFSLVTLNMRLTIGTLWVATVWDIQARDVEAFDIIAGGGNDDLEGGAFADTLRGGVGGDRLNGGDGDDVLEGGEGGDVLIGGGGANTISGGVGNDLITSSGTDTIDGGDGVDHLELDNFSGDIIFVAGGVSDCNGRSLTGVETFEINGNGGANSLTITEELIGFDNVFTGGDGYDRVFVNFSGLASSVTLYGGYLLYTSGTWYLEAFDVEEFNVISGDGADQLTGTSGNDILISRGGADTLEGGHGDDQLTGGLGDDSIGGGVGFDTAIYGIASTEASWSRTGATITLNAGAEGTDTLTNIEALYFTDRTVYLNQPSNTFSGDTTSDVLFRRTSDGVTVIWSLNGATVTSSAPTAWQAGAEWSLQAIGDFNSDGRDDFLLRRASDDVTAIWSMNGTNVIASDVTQWQAGAEWTVEAAGDFNGDGFSDILWRRDDGVTAIWNMNATAVVSASPTLWQAGNEWQIHGIGDFNGDGRDDFLWRRGDGVTSIWMMNGADVAAANVTNAQAGLEWDIAGIGDFNADGRDDLLLRRDTDGVMAIWAMNGFASNIDVTSTQAGLAWQVAAVGDYNGDGYADILLQNSETSLLAVWTMFGPYVFEASLTSQQAGFGWDVI